MKYILYKSI